MIIIPNINNIIEPPVYNFEVSISGDKQLRSFTPYFSGGITVNDVTYNLHSGIYESIGVLTIIPQELKNKVNITTGENCFFDGNNIITSPSFSGISSYSNVNVSYLGKTKSIRFTTELEYINTKTFISYGSGTLGEHIKGEVSNFSGSDINMYGSFGIRNQNVWTEDLDLTGIAFWNSRSNNVHRGGTLISPRHIVMAKHYPLVSGDIIRYVTNNNEVVERTVVGTLHQPDGYDITIGKLNSDVPNTVKFFKVMPNNWYDYLSIFDDGKLPILSCNRLRKIFKRYQINSWNNSIDYTIHKEADDTTSGIFSGDSGQPNFYLINGELVLLGCHQSASSYFNLSSFISDINTMMNTLGGGYNLTICDLSGFNYYG